MILCLYLWCTRRHCSHTDFRLLERMNICKRSGWSVPKHQCLELDWICHLSHLCSQAILSSVSSGGSLPVCCFKALKSRGVNRTVYNDTICQRYDICQYLKKFCDLITIQFNSGLNWLIYRYLDILFLHIIYIKFTQPVTFILTLN